MEEGGLGAQYLRRLHDGERVVSGTVEMDDCRRQLRMPWGKSAIGERGESPTQGSVGPQGGGQGTREPARGLLGQAQGPGWD